MSTPNWAEEAPTLAQAAKTKSKLETIELEDGEPPMGHTDLVDGQKHVVSYTAKPDNKVEKRTKIFKFETRKVKVNQAVMERRKWAKYGCSKDLPPGPDSASTNIVTDEIYLVLSSKKELADDKEPEIDTLAMMASVARAASLRAAAASSGAVSDGGVYKPKDRTGGGISAGGVYKPPSAADRVGDSTGGPGSVGPGGKYIPPSQREGAAARGASFMDRDDSNTVRVSNISESSREDDIRDLFKPFGPIKRCYVATDRITGDARGFAFVTFMSKSDAQSAIDHLNGYGYDHLILACEWAEERKDGPAR